MENKDAIALLTEVRRLKRTNNILLAACENSLSFVEKILRLRFANHMSIVQLEKAITEQPLLVQLRDAIAAAKEPG